MKKLFLLFVLLPLLFSCEAETIERTNFDTGMYVSNYFETNWISINPNQTVTINIENVYFTTSTFTIDYNSLYINYQGLEYKIYKTTDVNVLNVRSGELNYGLFYK